MLRSWSKVRLSSKLGAYGSFCGRHFPPWIYWGSLIIIHGTNIDCLYRRIAPAPNIVGDKAFIKDIGFWFISDLRGWLPREEEKTRTPRPITALHGRTCAIRCNETSGFVLLKGTGWTTGPLKYMVSPKDDELFFGLYDAESAQREYLISQYYHQS